MGKAELLESAKPLYEENQLLELEQAVDFAAKAHANQKRKSGESYMIHPLNVAMTLVKWGMDIDSVLAGILHDTVEDSNISLEQIENLFGYDVAFIVDGLTKVTKTSESMQQNDTYNPQTKDNLSKLLIAVGQDIRVVIIKLADRLHNLMTLNHLSRDKQIRIARESLEVYGPMADRLGMGRVRMQIEDIAFSYLEPREFKRVKEILDSRIGRSHRKLDQIKTESEQALKKSHIDGEINGRVKSVYSLYKKLVKFDNDVDNVYDLIALRVIVKTKEECYASLGILHSLYKPMINRIKDYIATPKPNGYQSLHTTVITPHEQIVEFQIRTQEMHEYAERGLAASFHYNERKTSRDYREKRELAPLPGNLQWITELQEVVAKLKSGEDISHDQLNIDLFKDRIFVHSPKGDIFNLPEGALPLDFAYMVHSDIGRHAYGFKVNGKIHPFDKPLQNGDVVEVITKKLVMTKPAWRNLVTTSHARHKLRAQLGQLGLNKIFSTEDRSSKNKKSHTKNAAR
ncbi:bifunctional (p)ppGpp synthetase/guanosine-3',5'-bis(diphosphate) 3'-pyrophosphohydrolase [Candidatus Saccharibacteria bacterium]|nr:bifunctional (p)ppGpp synthetase/guanosine-3',5'-bis(diphosphate) 3'-pyrophosphohydrolase [Candidatus Saccharibacteria bacterium]